MMLRDERWMSSLFVGPAEVEILLFPAAYGGRNSLYYAGLCVQLPLGV